MDVELKSAQASYKDILNTLQADETVVYEEIMDKIQKDKELLKVLDRMTQQEQQKENTSALFYNQTLVEVVSKFANTWVNIFQELFVERHFQTLQDVHDIFLGPDRKIYVGLMVVIVALFLFFIDISR